GTLAVPAARSDGDGTARAPKRSYVIGMIAKSQSNPVFIAARTGAEDAAKELGKQYGCEIKIDWRTPSSEDGQKQAEYLDALVAGGVDGVAISCSDAGVATLAIDSAVGKGVPVVCFDSDAPKSKRFAYYGTDDFACGQRVGQELAKAMGDKGVVAILAGNQNAPNLQSRVKGVREAMKGKKEITILDTYYHAETAQDAVARIEQVQGANPQITGWAFVGGWPLYTQNALDKVRGKAKVVSVDALPPCLPYLMNGDVEILLGQKVYEWGYESVRLLMDKMVNNKAPADPIVKAELVPVTKANAQEYGKNWDLWLGKTKAAEKAKK
ncbi:MAG: substrate-binding domain-containing protein, partial [Phycisphaerales bacterium]|nr:substrate-binding domain-containing protein [Phycisphaerales bacterium]